jgi:predicted dinucleotide-binding enzyme
VFGAGRVGNALAAYLAWQGIAVRAMSRHRPPALADVDQGTGPGVHGRRAQSAQEAPRAFAQAVTEVDGL